MENFVIFDTGDILIFKRKILSWIQQFDVACILDSHTLENLGHSFSYSSFDYMVAAGVQSEISSTSGNSLSDIDYSLQQDPAWYFGFLTYDYKNSIEKNLSSGNFDGLSWPVFYFFKPHIRIIVKNCMAEIQVCSEFHLSAEDVQKEILSLSPFSRKLMYPGTMKPRMTPNEYYNSINALQNHILRGDIYEVNFCQEFYDVADVDPFALYNDLSELSPSPFSCFLRHNDKFLISASPERFLTKRGEHLISQPVKGTAARSEDKNKDELIKRELIQNKKERAENIMIVDLVRNDLSKVAMPDSVKVDELCGIYSFSHVHQLISTVSCKVNTDSFEKIIAATFPMGSMTGAPKRNAMMLAEKYEKTKRGLYSGSVGYIKPDGDFDLNVIIRSLQYNSENKYLSYLVGGAITSYSVPEKEYEECMVKAAAMKMLLKNKTDAEPLSEL